MDKARSLVRLSCCFMVLCGLLVGGVFAESKSIALVTWRGITPAEEGFMKKLEELGVEADYEVFDAERDPNKLAGYLRDHHGDLVSKDLIYTFGTTATQIVQNFDLGGVPHVFNIVSDPVGTGIAASLSAPSNGTTGAQLLLSSDAILHLLEQIFSFKKMAILFDPREDNAGAEMDNLTNIAEAQGKQVTRLRLSPDAEARELQIETLTQALRQVDVVFITSASSFVANRALLRQIIPEDLVSVGATEAYLPEVATVAFGMEYWERGEAVAKLAAKILLEGVHPNDLPIDVVAPDRAILFVNKSRKSSFKLDLLKVTNPISYK